MRPEHAAANELLTHYVEGNRAAWEQCLAEMPVEIRPFAVHLYKRQRLNIEHNDHRYMPWCTVRPKRENQDET